MFFIVIAHELFSGIIFVVYLAQIINNRRRLSDLINYYNLYDWISFALLLLLLLLLLFWGYFCGAVKNNLKVSQ